MATVSKYADPRDYVYYQIEDGKLSLLTLDTDSVDEVLNTIDESVTAGVMLKVHKEPTVLDPEAADISAEELPMHARLHSAILDYVFHRLYLESPGINQERLIASKTHYNLFVRKVARLPNLMESGNAAIVMSNRTQLRK